MHQPIRFSISREAAQRAKSPIWGESFYEPSAEELSMLTPEERRALSVFEGDAVKGHRLAIFTMPPWDGIVARLRGEHPTGAADVDRAVGEREIREWLCSTKPVLKLTGTRTEEAVRISTFFNSMAVADESAPVTNAFVRRASRLVASIDLQLAHDLPEPLTIDRVVFDREFVMSARAEPRPLQRVLRDRIAARCAELAAWLPPSTVLEVGPVCRLTSNDSKSTGVCVLVGHPGSVVRNVIIFSAEADDD